MNKKVEPFVGEVLFGDGTRKEIVLAPSVFRFVKVFAGQMPGLLEGTGLNEIVTDLPNIISISRMDHDSLHQIDAARKRADSAEQQADFRLGQMDMKVSAVDMLRVMANGAAEGVRPGLILAADLVESLEVSHANS